MDHIVSLDYDVDREHIEEEETRCFIKPEYMDAWRMVFASDILHTGHLMLTCKYFQNLSLPCHIIAPLYKSVNFAELKLEVLFRALSEEKSKTTRAAQEAQHQRMVALKYRGQVDSLSQMNYTLSGNTGGPRRENRVTDVSQIFSSLHSNE
jgi:hypothetical protein